MAPRKTCRGARHLRGILERETQGRVALINFISQYLLLLQFPSDITDALISGQINLQKAMLFFRLTALRLGFSPRTRVRKMLGESAEPDIAGGLGRPYLRLMSCWTLIRPTPATYSERS